MSSDSDEHLVRYLLGDLPADESERLDERSITDDALALRLRVLEDDLVDRYARGERLGGSLDRLDAAQRESPYLQEKIRFAEALRARVAAGRAGATSGEITQSRRGPIWSLAAAAVLLLVAAGYLFTDNRRLQGEMSRLDQRRASVEQQNARMQQQLDDQRARSAPAVITSYLLPPPRRGESTDTTIAVRSGAQVVLNLRVESAEYATFWAALRDLESDRIVWRSADLTSSASGADRIVTINLPTTELRSQRYAVDLSGLATGGTAELLATYPLRVVLE